jgi:hypothetical protein
VHTEVIYNEKFSTSCTIRTFKEEKYCITTDEKDFENVDELIKKLKLLKSCFYKEAKIQKIN